MKKGINLKTIAFLAVLAFVALPAFSQGGPPPGGGDGPPPGGRRQMTEEDVKQRVKRQTENLGLSQEQEDKIMEFELEQYKKNQVERQKMEGDWEKMRAYMEKQREIRDKKYEEILTPEQYAQYKKNQEERMQRMRENGGPGGKQDGGSTTRTDRGRGR